MVSCVCVYMPADVCCFSVHKIIHSHYTIQCDGIVKFILCTTTVTTVAHSLCTNNQRHAKAIICVLQCIVSL